MVYIIQDLETTKKVQVQALNDIDALALVQEDNDDLWAIIDEYDTNYFLTNQKLIDEVHFPKEKTI